MASRHYKQWSPAERETGYQHVKKAQALGIIPYPSKCQRCTQTKGIIQLHCENYDFTINVLPKVIRGEIYLADVSEACAAALEELCWRCHMIHHSSHINPDACADYWRQIAAGRLYPPVFKHDFSILAREHGIVKRKNPDAPPSKPKSTSGKRWV